jgi:hypothetical protein
MAPAGNMLTAFSKRGEIVIGGMGGGRAGSAAVRWLKLLVRSPPRAWMSVVSVVC